MFIELHIIQSFAPSNLNRDDTNNPKDTEFGGVRRARISSQCIKRAIRKSPIFLRKTRVEQGIRTKRLAQQMTTELVALEYPEEEAGQVALAFAASYGGKLDKEGQTSVAIYLSPDEISKFVRSICDNWDAIINELAEGKNETLEKVVKRLVKETESWTSAPDIALFGRMLAHKPVLNLDAACQVAHAISTHRVSMEMDFFTAVDDLQQKGNVGAAMMGLTGFNSSTYYRYAALDWGQLVRNLDGDTVLAQHTVEAFLHAAVVAVPTGKQNAFAAQNRPDFFMVVVRNDEPMSLANAFERPIYALSNSGLVEPSIRALDRYWGELTTVFGEPGDMVVSVICLDNEMQFEHLQAYIKPNLQEWLQVVHDTLEPEHSV